MKLSNAFHWLIVACMATLLTACGATTVERPTQDKRDDVAVKITPEMASLNVNIEGKDVAIQRNQDQEHLVREAFAKTSRKCPPFCIRPITTAEGVETIAELEVLDYLQRMAGGEGILLIDNRTPEWHRTGTIPGAINVPFTKINRGMGADEISLAESLELFGAVETANGWDFSQAKTLVLFCNGMWCGQSPLGIDGLLAEGYPPEKLKWYRGGMQDWELLGLNTVTPE